jgi:transcription elongation factor Elf1
METTEGMTTGSGRTIKCEECKGKSLLSEYIITTMKHKGYKNINVLCFHCGKTINLDISGEPEKYNIYSRPNEEILGKRFK